MLTEMQERFFKILCDSINKKGYTPSIRELGKYVGLSSPATVKYYLDILERKGYIKRINRRKIEIMKGI